MPSSQNWADQNKNAVPGAKTNPSDPFPLKIGNTTSKYEVKVESNITDNGDVQASKLTLQKEATTRSGKSYVDAAVSYDGGKTWFDPSSGGKSGNKPITKGLLSVEEIKSLKNGELNKAAKGASQTAAQKAGATPKQQDQLANGNATATPKETEAQQAALKEEAATLVTGERKEYGFIKYPKYLKAEDQDCIKFSIIEYKPSGLQAQAPGGRTVSLVDNRPAIKGRNIIGTITLPIPAGIGDQNNVSWQSDTMTPFKEALGSIATGLIGGGAEAGKENAKTSIDAATAGGTGALKGLITAKFTEAITGTNNILARTLGAIENPNTELLFSGPELRTFSFRFKLTPRGPEEAKDVRTIIRCFKQAMSVKRTKSSLLLKAPHTFAISYISGNIQHPYLTKFKECALTGCSVDYTPYGSYMTYGKKKDKNGTPDIDSHSMVGYELSLTFQELEPLFDDEYGNEPSNAITNVGY